MSTTAAAKASGGDPVLTTWFSEGVDPAKVKRAAGQCTVILSDDDPYIDVEGAKIDFRTAMDPTIIVLHGHGHFNEDDNLTELPEALAAVVDGG
jgi:predicted alpha/beta hydrolase family esterase